ncbi:MAG: hypothetical protein CXT73_05815 [Methanobacteriota archaeon]|nr:MAG: hypothetical protein CXT73_05815 [Euryarchaeota archaeon]
MNEFNTEIATANRDQPSPFKPITELPLPPQISRCSRVTSRMGICTSPFEDLENQLDTNEMNLKRINSGLTKVDSLISQFSNIIKDINTKIDAALEDEAVKPKLEDISKQIKEKIANQQELDILIINKEELENEKSLLESFERINKLIKELNLNDNYKKVYEQIKTNYTDIIDYYNKNYKNATYDTKINLEYDLLIKNNVDRLENLSKKYIEDTLSKTKEAPRTLSPHFENLTKESTNLINILRDSPIPKDNTMHNKIEDLYYELVELYEKYDLYSKNPNLVERDNDQSKLYWQEIVNKITEYEHMLDDNKCFDEGVIDNNTFGGKKKKGRKTKRRQKAVNRKTKKVKRVKRVKMVKKRNSKRKTRKSSRK